MSRVLIFAVCAAFVFSPLAVADADAVLGKWWTEGKSSVVEITESDGTYKGEIVWLKDPLYEEGDPEAGEPLHDRNNPEKELQDRPILGLPLVKGFTYDAEDNAWKDGSIYDPEKGKTYSCEMKLDGDTLNVRGYIGTPLLGRTTQWVRLTEEEIKKLDEDSE
jgi:uncharacterized protein (DUF2147 family)